MNSPFISNTRLKLAKNQANAKQHPETGLLLNFGNYTLSSSPCHPKIIGDVFEKRAKNKRVCLMR